MKIPDWVFKGYGLPVESRNFSYVDMLNKEGLLVDHWRKGSSVPDISRQETQLWFYYLACLTSMSVRGFSSWADRVDWNE